MSAQRRLLATALVAGAGAGVLGWQRPAVDADRGESLARAAAWFVAFGASAWIALAALACLIALRRGRVGAARRCARAVPFGSRLLAELIVTGTAVATLALPAGAAPADQPVVRGPVPRYPAPVTTATTATTTPTTPTTRAPTPSTPAPTAPTAPAPRAPAPTTRARTPAPGMHVVMPGDNLWSIARATLAARGLPSDDAHVVPYWRALIEENRATLRSGDPSLIYPGEIVSLPPIP
jgi:hypothetical protein